MFPTCITDITSLLLSRFQGKNMIHRSHVQIFGFTQVACTQINTVCKYIIYLFNIVPLLSINILTLVNIIIDN